MWILLLVLPPPHCKASHHQRQIWFHITYAQHGFPFILCLDTFILISRILYDLSAYIYPSLQPLRYHRTSAEGYAFEELTCSIFQHFPSHWSCILMPMSICHIQTDVRSTCIIRCVHVPQIPPTPGFLSFIIMATEVELTLSLCPLSPPLPSHILPTHSPHSGSRQRTQRTMGVSLCYFGGPEIYPKWYFSVGAGKKLDPKSLCIRVLHRNRSKYTFYIYYITYIIILIT